MKTINTLEDYRKCFGFIKNNKSVNEILILTLMNKLNNCNDGKIICYQEVLCIIMVFS